MTEAFVRRPFAITAIAVVASALGIFGVVGSISALADPGDREPSLGCAGQLPGRDPAVARQIQQGLLRISRRHRRYLVPLHSANLVLSAFLFLAAMSVGRLRRAAPGLFTQAALGNALYRVVASIVQVRLGADIVRLHQRLLPRLVGPLAGGEEAARGSVNVGIAIAVGLAAAVALVEIAFYVFAVRYVRKPAVRALFGAGG